MSVEKYQNLLRRLLPPGKLFTVPPGGNLDKLLAGIATELFRIETRAFDLLEELDPRTTTELLTDWETFLGLPGNCETLGATLQERRDSVLAKLTQIGAQNKNAFVDIAAKLGYTITVNDIITYRPMRAGDPCGSRCYGIDWVHTFGIRLTGLTTRPFRASANRAGDRLLEYGDDLLECLIEQAKPAHSNVLFIAVEE